MTRRRDRRNYREFSDRDDLYRTNARTYRTRDKDGRLRRTRAGTRRAERAGTGVRDAWDRFSNHEDQTYGSERDNARLEREYAEGSRWGFGYSRYPEEDYRDYDERSGSEYYDDSQRRARRGRQPERNVSRRSRRPHRRKYPST